VADAVTLLLVEEEHLVCFGDRINATHVAHVNTAIRKHQMRSDHALFSTFVLAFSIAGNVPERHRLGVQKKPY
jgi:hypothetical protein